MTPAVERRYDWKTVAVQVIPGACQSYSYQEVAMLAYSTPQYISNSKRLNIGCCRASGT